MKTGTILLATYGKIPLDKNSSLRLLEDELDLLSDEQRDEVAGEITKMSFAQPSTILWIGGLMFGFLGLDRFMMRHYFLFFVKIFLFFAIFISLFLSFFTTNFIANIFQILGLMLIFAIFIITDIFTLSKRSRRENLQKLFNIIQKVKQ